MTYPSTPGHRGVDTSIAAANALAPRLGRLQQLALETIRDAGGLTSDELAGRLGVERWAMRPRTAELRKLGLIIDTGQRRRNCTGRASIVWFAK